MKLWQILEELKAAVRAGDTIAAMQLESKAIARIRLIGGWQ